MKSISLADGRISPAPFTMSLLFGCLCWLLLAIEPARSTGAEAPRRPARIFILMVWDGLRPDFVTPGWTPNLFAMENEGVRFAHHHSIYPTITMVNAAGLATGAPPGITTILGDKVYLQPRVALHKIIPASADSWANHPVDLENSTTLAVLNGPRFFNGALLGSESLGQQVRHAGGYLAIVGKKGPAFIFDDSVSGDPAPDGPIAGGDFIFVSDDLIAPPALKSKLAPVPRPTASESVLYGASDSYFAQVASERALKQARAAALGGHPALVVLWQHNPDVTEHHRGLGTRASLEALKICDANLGRVRRAIARLGIAGRTDLMVVSDHGFATIRAMVPLGQLLVADGLKKSVVSDDVTVVPNGGTDLVHLSRTAFPTIQEQRAILQKMTDFIEAQSWAGPLFTRSAEEERALAGGAAQADAVSAGPGSGQLGWIAGTFSLGSLGMVGRNNFFDAPDLVVSFRELPDVDNRGLTGPGSPIYVFDERGEQKSAIGNNSNSNPLVMPVKGVMYADTGGGGGYTTGLGMHAAAGERELHNFCAAVGPDFRRHFVDQYPSGNLDLRATIARAMDLPSENPATSAGRSLDEALADHEFQAATSESRLAVSRTLSAATATTTLDFSVLSAAARRWFYLDGVEYRQTPLTR